MSHMTLKKISAGETAFVVAVNAREAERRRLESLGIVPGTEVSVLSHGSGTVLLMVGNSRIALESHIADEVYVA